jgi:hypothetical protein
MRDILSELDLGEDKMSDPVQQVQKGLRKQLPKRFYTKAGVRSGSSEGGFVVTLDDKPVRTPSRRELGVPFEARRSGGRRMGGAEGAHRSVNDAADPYGQHRYRRSVDRRARRCLRKSCVSAALTCFAIAPKGRRH